MSKKRVLNEFVWVGMRIRELATTIDKINRRSVPKYGA